MIIPNPALIVQIGCLTAKCITRKPQWLALSLAAGFLLMAASAARSQSSFYFSGSASSWVSHGITELITTTNGTIVFNSGYSYDHGLHLNINTTSGQYWSLDCGAIDRGQLHVGLYTNATRFPFNNGSSPGLSFTGNGRGDNNVTGWFNVLSIAYSNNVLVSAAIDFVQYDEGILTEKTSGYIRYNTVTSLGPDFTTAIITNGAISFAWNAGPGQVFQLQYCTDMSSTNWFNLSASITASNAMATVTDNNVTNQQRFYRLKRLLP